MYTIKFSRNKQYDLGVRVWGRVSVKRRILEKRSRGEPIALIKIAKALDLAGYTVHSLEPAMIDVTGKLEGLLTLEVYPKKSREKPAL